MVELESLAIAAVVTLKVAVVAAAATATEPGTVRVALVLFSGMLAPPPGATLVSVTVQVLDAFGPRLAGLQKSEETSTGATSVMVALAELLL
jgi:hypothetical protein